MHVIVLIKEVPDMDQVRFNVEEGVIDRKSAGAEVNPFDLNALEAAVQLKEQTDCRVTALCMGPPKAERSLKEAIARGADEALLLSDPAFGGSDTWATSQTLTAAIRKLGDFDYIFAGEKTVDGDTGQVGAEVAELLSIPHISYVEKLEWRGTNGLSATVSLWDALYRKSINQKGLLTFTKASNTPRLPTIRDKMKARKLTIPVWHLSDLEGFLSESDTGFSGSPTKVRKIVIPVPPARQGKIYRDDHEAALDDLRSFLISRHYLKEEKA